MKTLTIQDIIQAGEVAREEIEVPEWGGKIIIQQMTAEGRDAFEYSCLKKNEEGLFERDLTNTRAKLVAACAINEDGSLMFRTPDMVKVLGKKSAQVVDRIFEACQKLNAITDSDIEELEKN